MDSEPREKIETPDGVEIRPTYGPADGAVDYQRDLGFPGAYPFTRGIYPTMYRGRLWTMRQYAGFGAAEESNRRFRYLLGQGQTGLSIAFDMPTQMGYDSDHPMAEPEVGKVGVAIDSLLDMEVLLEGIPLDRVTTSMTINATAAILLAMYIAVADRHGVPAAVLDGTTQNDILKEYIARGTYIFPPRPSLRLITDMCAYCADYLPKWNPISVSGYHIREAGATAVQEVAFTLADGIAYLQAAVEAGLSVDRIAPRLSFFFAAQMNLLEEVAKFRAARRLWARIVRERFGAADPRSWMLRFHTQTGGATLTAQQPVNNVVRVALQALAAVLGGTQSLHTNAYDEALALPTAQSATLALRTQQVLAHETGVPDTVDPAGGSWYVEHLTDRLEREARALIAEIEGAGGAARAVERGVFQAAIARSAYEQQKALESEEMVVVGVNKYADDVTIPSVPAPDYSALAAVQRRRVVELRGKREKGNVKRVLGALESAARDATAPLMEPIIDAVRARCTVGEISDVMRG